MANRETRRSEHHGEEEKKTTYYRQQRSPIIWGASVVILVIIIIALVFAPVLQIVGTDNDITFGSYAKRDISMRWGDDTNYMYQYVKANGSDVTSDFGMTLLWNRAFESAAQREAFLHYLDQADAAVSQNRSEDLLVDYFTSDGVFYREQYLNTSKTDLRVIEAQLEEQARISYLTNSIDGFTITPQGQLDLIADLQKEQRSFTYTHLSASNYPTENLQAYVDANPNQFKDGEIALITFETSDDYTLADVEAEYNNIQESSEAFQALLDTDQDRDEFYTQPKTTGSFAKLQSRFVNGSDLEQFFANGTTGDISPLMESANGDSFVVIQLLSNPAPFVLEGQESLVLSTIESLNPEVIETFLETESSDVVAQLENGTTMEYIANEKGLSEYTAANNTIQYNGSTLAGANYFGMGGIQGDDGTGLFTSTSLTEEQIKELFSMEQSDVTRLETPRGTLVVMLDEITINESEENSIMELGYNVAEGQAVASAIQNNILKSPLFKDNFTEVYRKKVLGN